MKQKTILKPITLSGIGLHTGNKTSVTLSPNMEGTGLVLLIEGQEPTPLRIGQVISTNRSINIQIGDATIFTVEHVLSALAANAIDQVLISVEGGEVPILDGSSKPFVEAIQECGCQELDGEQGLINVHETFVYEDEQTGAKYRYTPSEDYRLSCTLDFDDNAIGEQYASIKNFEKYREKIAPSKTFVFVHELEQLFDAGLIRGGSFANAIVFAKKKYKRDELKGLATKFGVSLDDLSEGFVLNEENRSFQNEPARHKLLDLIGDLYLLGAPIKGRIDAFKPGHAANVRFAKELLKRYKDEQRTGVVPKYDPEVEPMFDLEGIKKLLPHRFPFLLIDKVLTCTNEVVVAVKNISADQFFFPGHFPGNPVFPGVLQMEALAQTGGILALNAVDEPELYDTYFLKMDNVKFKQLVKPGDTLILKMELLTPIRRGIVHMQGRAYVGSKIVSEGELTARIQKRTTV